MSEKQKGVIFCSYEGKWKDELEKRLQRDERVTLTALGRIRYKLLGYLEKRKDIEIVKVETRYMKNRDKGIGIKITVRKLSKSKPTSRTENQQLFRKISKNVQTIKYGKEYIL